MVSSRAIAVATAAVFVGAATPALASPAQAAPLAHAAGDPAPAVLTYPSLVNERLVRVQAAMDRATASADEHQPDAAAATLLNARANLRKAWTAAQYLIDNAPPPVAPVEDAFAQAKFHPGAFTSTGRLRIRMPKVTSTTKATKKHTSTAKAHKAGDPPVSGMASIYDTAYAVLALQHQMATLATGLLDTAHGTWTGSLNTSLFTALNGRDQAIEAIHVNDLATTPPPPVEDKVIARAAQDDVVPVGWAATMPNLVGLLDDEIQQVNGTIAIGGAGLPLTAKHILQDALTQDTASENKLNTYWPPLPPAED
jgi:hypothetical protein